MKYAVINPDRMPIAFYDDRLHAEIPDEAVPLTDDQWADCLAHQGARRITVNEDGDDVEVSLYEPPPDIEALRAARIAAIKRQAGRVIEAAYPSWKQRNLIARATELQNQRLDGATLTPEEQAEADAIQAAWGWIKEVRLASDTAETSIMAAADLAAVEAVALVVPD